MESPICMWTAKMTYVNMRSVFSLIFVSFDQHLKLHFLKKNVFQVNDKTNYPPKTTDFFILKSQ